MNNRNRKIIKTIIANLEDFDFLDIKYQIEELQIEEEEKIENLPEGLQDSEASERLQAASDSLQEAVDAFDDIENSFIEIYEALERATEQN